MRLINSVVGIISVLLYFLSFSVAFAEEKTVEDKDFLKVGSIVLTKMDIDLKVQQLVPMQLSFHGGMDAEKKNEIKEQAVDELLTVCYKALYAIEEEIAVDSASFEAEWKKLLSKNKNLSAQSQPYLWGKVRAGLYSLYCQPGN